MIANSDLYCYDPLSKKIEPYTIDTTKSKVTSSAIAADSSIWAATNSDKLKNTLRQRIALLIAAC